VTVSAKNALSFVEQHGIVLESGHGPVPNLAEAIAGGVIRGSWWSHKKGHAIFAATQFVRDSQDILVCRLVRGKVTLVHRRLWPALVRLADRFGNESLAAISEKHTASGAHRTEEMPFPDWVPQDVTDVARKLSEQEAVEQLGESVADLLLKDGQQTRHRLRKSKSPGLRRTTRRPRR
jgi:hypothetical protein